MPTFLKKERMHRTVIKGEVHHIYQQTAGGVVLFYSMRDYLVFFTIYCSMAEKLDVTVLALCPMPDHIHSACIVTSEKQLDTFVQLYTRTEAREWNTAHGRKGSLFRKGFGSAPKFGNKAARTTLNYNYNNPVERKIVDKAEEYRWNFLAYYCNKHPYSEPIKVSSATLKMRAAMREARKLHTDGAWVSYAHLDRWMRGLSVSESKQLADYIICTWNVIDYARAISYYGSYDAMIRSFHDNTGAEHEIREETDKYSDSVYADCSRILLRERMVSNLTDIPALPVYRKMEIYKVLEARTTARYRQICKYLHLPTSP